MNNQSNNDFSKLVLREIAQIGEAIAPEDPHLYSVADLEECPKRRWLTIAKLVKNKYLAQYHKQVYETIDNKDWALHEVCSNMIHLILGGAVGGFLVSGRVWEVGPTNVSVRTNVLGGFDWQGAIEPKVRVLPDDPYVNQLCRFTVVEREDDLADWLIVQSMLSLTPIMEEICKLSKVPEHKCWEPLTEMLNTYCRVAKHAFPKKREVIERRTQLLIESAIRLGLCSCR